MGAAAYNRGSKSISHGLEGDLARAMRRADRTAISDEVTRLRERVAFLERRLKRATACVTELRRSKEERLAEAREEQRRSDSAIGILTRIAFPADRAPADE